MTAYSAALTDRLRELSDAVTRGPEVRDREFTMRVPAEPDRDADLVLSTAADEIDRLRESVTRLRSALIDVRWELHMDVPTCAAMVLRIDDVLREVKP